MKKQTVNSNKSFSSFIFGENSLLIQCSEILLEKGHEIYGIVTLDSKIVKWAAAKKITIIDSDANSVTKLKERPFDYLFSIANLYILSDEILELPRKGAINFHDGPLPKYAGINTPSWAILNREKHYGVTWHMMNREVDKGNILKQVTFDIAEEETALTLNAKCFEAASNSFAVLVDELSEGTNKPQKQNFEERTYYSRFKRPANGCIVSLNETAEHISTFCRALDFGPYLNPLGSPKIKLNGDFMIIGEIEVLKVQSDAVPGTITRIEDNQIRIATNSQDVALRKLMTINGLALPVSNIVKRYRLTEGSSLERLGSEDQERITCFNSEICKKEAFWVRQLEALNFVDIHYTKPDNSNANLDEYEVLSLELPTNIQNALTTSNKITDIEDLLLTAFCLYVGQLSRSNSFTLGYSNSDLRKQLLGLEGLFATHLPLQIQINESDTIATSVQKILNQIEIVRQNKSYIFDISTRYPQFDKLTESDGKLVYPIVVESTDQLSGFRPQTGCILTLVVVNNLSELHWVYNPFALSQVNVKLMQNQFLYFLNAIFNNTENKTLSEISLITPNERNKLIQEWNNTRSEYEKDICIHKLFEAQVEMSPDDIAVFCNGKEITYRELNSRANQLANYLRNMGVGPEVLVGVCLHRSVDMMVAIYGILKAGGAYVPLDPGFPKDRLKYMLADSRCKVLLTEAQLINDLPLHTTQVIAIDSEWQTISKENAENIDGGATSENLSYVIYTSGTTGQPKGVMVNHKNVVNFFTGMDKHVQHNPPGVWLAVTSLSFDISVLELFWTLARGFKVVLYAEEDWKSPNSHTVVQSPDKSLDFSLFYFSSSERDKSGNKYQLLLEGAKFGDKHGFKAVWTPERHFHEFGGLYPNPSVTSAALATITNHIQLRCGSCVSPLHSPIRIAEEWSVVDNLSNGRIGISFAAGWQPNDFVFRPGTYENRKEIMFQQIETVQKLWRGETVQFQNGTKKTVDVKTLPRPIQKELPVWITAANNPETFRMAGERGFHLLTHLLGQSVDELSEKVAIYRKAWNDGGHARDKGVVTLMLHTFIGRDLEEVREIVREPMKQYLASAINLVELASWYFPTYKKLDNDFNNAVGQLTDEDKDAILNHAFERYFNTSSLLGTPDSCLKMIDKIKAAGVDEVGCLIDFGVKPEIVLNHLHYLNTVKTQAN
ncbi:MAG: MupA/Atu3671 family FMN-dependent luciferase-like monooxygenase, partial [bacterium]